MFPSDELVFTEMLDSLVFERANASASFDDLVRMLPGVYPTDVLVTLERLHSAGRLASPQIAKLCSRSMSALHAPPSDFLPPHPLDFDWRFSATTIRDLANSLIAEAHGDQIVLLGTPSLLHAIQAMSHAAVLLVDSGLHLWHMAQSNRSIASLDVTQDLLPRMSARLLIMDPPWYPEHFRAFLWAAAQLVIPGGQVWTTFPSRGTRPAIARELDDMVSYATSLGMRRVGVDEGAIRYDSPPFELSALEAAGLPGLPLDWRAADLVSFIVRSPTAAPRPRASLAQAWDEVSLGSVRVRLRPRQEVGQPLLETLVPGDVLQSVSTRDPMREQADVWTTCNRIFRCSNTVELANALRERSVKPFGVEAPSQGDAAERPAGLQWQIDELLRLERSDLSRFGWLN